MKICNATLHEKKIELKSNEIKITSANEVMLMHHATHHSYNRIELKALVGEINVTLERKYPFHSYLAGLFEKGISPK